ncbi:hypothetical protein DPMN_112019 [Dreissena polymorpha]|uniref:Uncharacterized protein n=1 Tax=Dreissena polymorpha TaxID=45954 RepID=A0A9D4KEW2_DREPO|nr:hypothetical protein DPMN_112019 [Dreissena polymorpha]
MNMCICATIVHHLQAYNTETAREIEDIAKMSNKLNKFNRPGGRQPFRGIYRSRSRGYRGFSGRGTSRGGNMSYNSPLQGPSNYPDSKKLPKEGAVQTEMELKSKVHSTPYDNFIAGQLNG